MPLTEAAAATLSAFAQATLLAFQDVLSQALGADWKAVAGSPDIPPVAGKSLSSIGLLVTGVVSGQAAVQLSQTDAALLGRAFVGDTSDAPAEYGEEQREAVEELMRQVFGLVTTTLQASYGQLWIEVDRAILVAEPGQRSSFVLTSASKPSLVCELLVSSELANSFAAAEQKPTAPEPSLRSANGTLVPPPPVTASQPDPTIADLSLLTGVEVEVTLRFGHRWLALRDVMNLTSGSVVELDESVSEPVEIVVDDRMLARGEIVSVDGCYGVRILETIAP